MQLHGQDMHTKALMNRLATGQATGADYAEWNNQVRAECLRNNVYVPPPIVSRDNEYVSTSAHARPDGVSSHSPGAGMPVDHDLAMADYEMQLALLEGQNRPRKTRNFNGRPQASQNTDPRAVQGFPLHVSREVAQDATIIPPGHPRSSSVEAANNPASSPDLMDSTPPVTNYQQQLIMLEQQNRRRLIMARQETERLAAKSENEANQQMTDMLGNLDSDPSLSEAEAHVTTDYEEKSPPVPKARIEDALSAWTGNGNHALQDYQMQLQLLDQQAKRKEWMRLQALYGEPSGPDFDVVSYMTQEQHIDVDYPMTTSARVRRDVHSQILESIKDKWSSMDGPQRFPKATGSAAEVYCQPFCDFLTDNPTVFHAVDATKNFLKGAHWTELNEREAWVLKPSGKYFVERNGSSLIAFVVGANYEPGNGAAILAGHVDALCAKLKPVSEVPNNAGYLQLGVAPYAGAMSDSWWDRDLGIGGRVLVKEGTKIVTKLVKLDRPIARIPSLAPHFGAAAQGPFNKETQMTPIIGLEDGDSTPIPITKGATAFVSKQPPALVRAIGNELGLSEQTYSTIVNWELELFDIQPATVGGLNKEFIYGGRIDDKLCSWAAMQALTGSALYDTRFSSLIKVVAWFDNEEIGSQLRQGAHSNFLPQVLERAVGSLSSKKHHVNSDLLGRTYANSFLVSSDVTHAINPNFMEAYLRSASPKLNTGLVVCADANGHLTTDAVSTSILQRCAGRVGAKLQLFQIRNDSRSGGTVGPMLSSMTGIRAIDAGMPQLSMHSIRATTGSLDPGLGVIMFTGFLNGFEHVDKEFR